MRTAIVGCGKVAHLHAAALRDLDESEFVAVCDADAARSASFAQQYGVRSFADVVTMVTEARAEAVIICTPHPVHAVPTIAACNAGARWGVPADCR